MAGMGRVSLRSMLAASGGRRKTSGVPQPASSAAEQIIQRIFRKVPPQDRIMRRRVAQSAGTGKSAVAIRAIGGGRTERMDLMTFRMR